MNKKYNLCYGRFIYNFINDPECSIEIIAYKEPSFVHKVAYENIVSELFQSSNKLSESDEENNALKKIIANVQFGLLEKSYNKQSKSFVFDTIEECNHYRIKYGGKMNYIEEFVSNTVCEENGVDLLDEGMTRDEDEPTFNYSVSFISSETGNKSYILTVNERTPLINGFRYIKEYLMQYHNLLVHETYNKLTKNGVDVCSVKTDACVIRSSDFEKARTLIDFDNGFGTWRKSKDDNIILPTKKYEQKENHEIKIEPLTVKHLDVPDEYDTIYMCKLFEQYKRVMVRAEYAGCGKSYACKEMEKLGHKVLFVCPTNKLAQNNKEHGVTLNKFFSVGMKDNEVIAKFDDSIYDVIVFDEIYFADIQMLTRIKKYSETKLDKIIIATGDTNQLETVEQLSNTISFEEYSEHCINTIFPNSICLTINKRLQTDEDRNILKQFKLDIFNADIQIKTTITKYFKMVDKIITNNNIALRNEVCDNVSKTVRKMKNMIADYEVGENLICRKYLKIKNITFNVNYEYVISQINDQELVLSDHSINNSYSVPIKVVKANFIHGYCRTCHSLQGSSISSEITIFDWDLPYTSRKWIYTAITRATEFKNVNIYSGKSQVLNEIVLDTYLSKKINGYRQQDKAAKRLISKDNYITMDWLKKCFGTNCKCGVEFIYEYTKGNITSNLTADRIDNDEDHNLCNIKPLCVLCNTSKSNK